MLKAEGEKVAVSERPVSQITPRCVVIGFAAIIPGVFWGVYGDIISQTDLTSMSLMMPPVLIVLALLVVNTFMRRIRPAWVLNQTELMTIYAMLTVSIVVTGMGMIQFLCTTLGAVPHFKTPQNGWDQYLGYIPQAILPKLSAIDGFYKGGQPIPWGAWKMPLVLWSGFLFSMLLCMFCINTIMRKQWMDRERLTFPIVQIPLEMTDPKTNLFSKRLMWVGFLIAAGLESMNSLNYLYPSVPYVQLRAYNLSSFVSTPPWSSMGYIPSTFYPLAIGLGFLMSADLSFSCWFFFLFTRLENVFTAAIGLDPAGGGDSNPPYLGQQGVGAFLGIVMAAVYMSRRHLGEVAAKALKNRPDVDDSAEPLSYRTAVGGLVLGFAAMVVFCRYVGLSPQVSVVYLGIYIAMSTAITRMRAEAGPAWVMQPYMTAFEAVVKPAGSAALGPGNLIGLAYFNWFSDEMRCCPMPAQLESMKIAQALRARQRVMAIVVLLAIVAGIAVGFWACLGVWYEFGAGTAKCQTWRTVKGKQPFDQITTLVLNPTKPDLTSVFAIGIGAAVTCVLSFMRSRFIWFPFHPAGYALANSGTLYWLWLPFLIAWVCKVTITKYGGSRGYRAAMPFFLGLVLGDYITSSLWALAGSILGISMYRCFPC